MVYTTFFPGDDRDRALLLEAGASLSSLGFNNAALQYFGLRWLATDSIRSMLSNVSQFGMPVFMAPSLDVLEQNGHLVSTTFRRAEGSEHRRLALCFDRTYLVSTLQLVQTQHGSILAGGPHRPSGWDGGDESALKIDRSGGAQQFDTKKLCKANEMLSFITFDVTRRSSPTLEVGAFPVLSSASRNEFFETNVAKAKNKKGKYETLARVGGVLSVTPAVRWIFCDSAGSHDWCRKLLLGQPIDLAKTLLDPLPFWKELRMEDLPDSIYKWGYRVVKAGGECICFGGGPQHVQKNMVEQLRSVLRTISFGSHWCDPSALADLGLLPCSYVGADSMSDWQAALWFLDSTF